jgi:alpha-glucosidase (family GH31 glycosyl hydrolase)
VVEPGAKEWRVYLPEGDWVGPVGEAAGLVTVPAPLDGIPVFCKAERAAALVPLFSDDLVEVS